MTIVYYYIIYSSGLPANLMKLLKYGTPSECFPYALYLKYSHLHAVHIPANDLLIIDEKINC